MNIYSAFRSCLSHKNKGVLTKFLIESGLKPKVNRKADSPFKKGIVVFSADFEWLGLSDFLKLCLNQQLGKDLLKEKYTCSPGFI